MPKYTPPFFHDTPSRHEADFDAEDGRCRVCGLHRGFSWSWSVHPDWKTRNNGQVKSNPANLPTDRH